ncbi:MAG: Glu/Leu/Phe/Val dehydrogenase dimerization domain-containing protein [Thermodesulfobacteriota bacterium]
MKFAKPSATNFEKTDIPHTPLMEESSQLLYKESEDKIHADSAGKVINFPMEKKHGSVKVKTDILNREQELILEYRDSLEGFKGWAVMHALSHKLCAGGVRVQKGLTLDCVRDLASNMTTKMRIAGIRADGAKCGINYDPHSPGKKEALYRFIRAIRPYVLERYSLGPDLNTTMCELDDIAERLSIPAVKMAIAKAQGFDLPSFLKRYRILKQPFGHATLGRLRAGFGLAAACQGVLEFLNIPPQEATVAIQGFGGLGSSAAYTLHEAGIKIIAIADEEKSLISTNNQSLDIKAMLPTTTNCGTGFIPSSGINGRYGDPSQIYDVKCDVFIPAAIENVITVDNAGDLPIKAVVTGANLAVTHEAEKILIDRGIIIIPDFVAGCGGSLSMDGLFGPEIEPSAQEVLKHVNKKMRRIVKKVIKRSQQDGVTTREAALRLCSEVTIYPEARPYGPLDM